MSSNRWIILAAGIVLVVLSSAFAYDQSNKDSVAKGVSVGGVDISGLSTTQAQLKLRRALEEPLLEPIRVSYEGEVRRLTAASAEVDVDVDGMVDEALKRGSSKFFVVDAIKTAAGADRNVSIAARVDYSEAKVDKFIRGIRRKFNRDAKDAKVTYTATGLGEVDGQTGLSVRTAQLREEIMATFADPDARRKIKLPVKVKQPKVRRSQLAKKFPVILVVDRKGFKLRVYKKLKHAKTYGIAVGKVGMDTPSGLYSINSKQINPSWYVPDSDWAGKLRGKVIPPGPNNPIKARWLGIYDGVGIHGTDAVDSIGSAASHGCIRMIPKQVIELYDQVPIGTQVFIA
ncbi:MAG: L,D-transpeptidase family protein [Solirubrobacterales bacterium]